jgi:hypothetical protein
VSYDLRRMTQSVPPGTPSASWGTSTPGGLPAPVTARTSGLAVASLVTGLFFWCFLVPGIVAIVLGHVALDQIDRSGGTVTGRGMAVAGIVLGWIGIGLLGLGVVVWFFTVLAI